MDVTIVISYMVISSAFLVVLLPLVSNSNNRRKKNLPPSVPLALPVIGHLYLMKKPLHQTLARLSSCHGPLLLLRFGSRPVLVISSAALADEAFTKNDIAFANRPQVPSKRRPTYNYTTLASSSYGPHWRNIRRIATVEILSSARLNAMSDARTAEVRALVRGMFQNSDMRGEELTRVVLKGRLFGLTVNLIMGMLTGKRYYGGQENGGSVETRMFQEIVEEILCGAGTSNLGDFLPRFLQNIDFDGGVKKMAKGSARFDKFMQRMLDEHRKEKKVGEKTMISNLLAMQQEEPQYYTDEIIKAMIVTLLLAGIETSAQTLEWAMSHLLNSPEALKKARAEIDARVGSDRLLEEQDMASLPYVHAIVNETLRVTPTAPLLVPHESAEECTLGAYTIPSGTMILLNAWAIHRAPETWPEPTKFMPERFLPDKDGKAGGGCCANKIIAFGLGRRRCAGEGLALRVIPFTLASLIQCFDWERVGEDEVDMTEGGGITLAKAVPLEAMFKPRKIMVDVLSRV